MSYGCGVSHVPSRKLLARGSRPLFCSACGSQIPDASKYCYKCGSEVVRIRIENHPSPVHPEPIPATHNFEAKSSPIETESPPPKPPDESTAVACDPGQDSILAQQTQTLAPISVTAGPSAAPVYSDVVLRGSTITSRPLPSILTLNI